MIYLEATLALILLIGGVCWLVFIRRWLLWLATMLNKGEKFMLFSASPAGKLVLWRLRMSGILWILLASFLFVAALAPGLLAKIPGYAIAIWIGLPISLGFIFFQIAIIRLRKQKPTSGSEERH